MKYITPKEAAERWGISRRRVHILCGNGRIEGAERYGGIWLIPDTAKKPEDARIKSGRYIKSKPISEQKNVPDRTDRQRFSIPLPLDYAIARPRLLERIAPSGSLLTYIYAPAGYGKSTLLSQYAKGRGDAVWLTVVATDDDALSFLRRLENAIKKNEPHFDFHATDYTPFLGNAAYVPIVLEAFLRALGESRLTLILDDVHVISDKVIIAFFDGLVRRCPPNLVIIMASRHMLWDALLRLKLEGKIAEITDADLCFSEEETAEFWGFFDETAYQATEGWALAVQSYRMVAKDGQPVPTAGMRADNELFRYLLGEIFSNLPEEIQHFLKATSRLPELDCQTCDILLGIQNAQGILEELVRRNIFTQRVDVSSYRYHALFKKFLQRNDGGLGMETLRRAMAQCFERGDYEQAGDYALLIGDAAFIHECINAALGRLFGRGCYQNLKKYFDCMETHRIVLSPRVLLARGMYLSSQGLFAEADACLNAVPDLSGEDRMIQLYALTHKARVLRHRASFEESTRCIDSLQPLLVDAPPEVWYMVMIEKIYNLTMSSRLSEALDLTQTMMEKCLACGSLKVRAWFERYLTVIYFFKGDYKNALLFHDKSLSLPAEEREWLLRHCTGAYAAKAYQMAGEDEKAISLMEAEIENIRQLGFFEELGVHYLIYADILYTKELQKIYAGKTPDYSLLNRYLSLAEERTSLNRQEFALYAKALRMRACMPNEPESAKAYIREMLPLMERAAPFFQAMASGHIASVLQMLERDAEQCKEYYGRCIRIGEETGSFLYPTIAYGEAAALYLREGDEGTAEKYVRKFMELSRHCGQRRWFKFKPLIGDVLKLAERRGITPEFTREMLAFGGYAEARVYINTLGGFYVAPNHDRQKPVKIRTYKARELLAYLLEHREGVSIERISAEIWEESEANDVSSLFHTRRGEIRRAFESMGAGNPIVRENGVYRLRMDEIACDLDSFRQAVADFKKQASLQNAQRVVDLYTGRYLDDMEALWAESARLRFEEAFLNAAETLMENYGKSGDRAKTLELLRQCTTLSGKRHI